MKKLLEIPVAGWDITGKELKMKLSETQKQFIREAFEVFGPVRIEQKNIEHFLRKRPDREETWKILKPLLIANDLGDLMDDIEIEKYEQELSELEKVLPQLEPPNKKWLT